VYILSQKYLWTRKSR